MLSNFAPEIAECEADADIVSIILDVGNLPVFFFWGFGTIMIHLKNCWKYEHEQK